MTERWAPIPGHPGYEASDQGRVRSIDRVITSVSKLGRAYERTSRGQVLEPGDDGRGYLQLSLGRGSTQKVHVLVALAFHGPRPAGTEACHRDGNPLNNTPVNLRWDTSGANKLDAVRHGTHFQSKKERCRRRHLLVAPNLVPWGLRTGKRSCLACSRARGFVRDHPGADMQSESDRYYVEIMEGEQTA